VTKHRPQLRRVTDRRRALLPTTAGAKRLEAQAFDDPKSDDGQNYGDVSQLLSMQFKRLGDLGIKRPSDSLDCRDELQLTAALARNCKHRRLTIS
jgi:hypothetical protein